MDLYVPPVPGSRRRRRGGSGEDRLSTDKGSWELELLKAYQNQHNKAAQGGSAATASSPPPVPLAGGDDTPAICRDGTKNLPVLVPGVVSKGTAAALREREWRRAKRAAHVHRRRLEAACDEFYSSQIRQGKDKLAAWENAAAKYPSLGRSLFLRADEQEPPSPPSPEDEERARRRFEEKLRESSAAGKEADEAEAKGVEEMEKEEEEKEEEEKEGKAKAAATFDPDDPDNKDWCYGPEDAEPYGPSLLTSKEPPDPPMWQVEASPYAKPRPAPRVRHRIMYDRETGLKRTAADLMHRVVALPKLSVRVVTRPAAYLDPATGRLHAGGSSSMVALGATSKLIRGPLRLPKIGTCHADDPCPLMPSLLRSYKAHARARGGELGVGGVLIRSRTKDLIPSHWERTMLSLAERRAPGSYSCYPRRDPLGPAPLLYAIAGPRRRARALTRACYLTAAERALEATAAERAAKDAMAIGGAGEWWYNVDFDRVGDGTCVAKPEPPRARARGRPKYEFPPTAGIYGMRPLRLLRHVCVIPGDYFNGDLEGDDAANHALKSRNNQLSIALGGYGVIEIWAFGITGAVIVPGSTNPRFVVVKVYEMHTCRTYVKKITVPELQVLLADRPQLLAPGYKMLMCKALVAMCYFREETETETRRRVRSESFGSRPPTRGRVEGHRQCVRIASETPVPSRPTSRGGGGTDGGGSRAAAGGGGGKASGERGRSTSTSRTHGTAF